jgi:hypothetical protein
MRAEQSSAIPNLHVKNFRSLMSFTNTYFAKRFFYFVSENGHSLLKRHDAKRQREEWHYRIFQVKAVKVYGAPQEKEAIEIVKSPGRPIRAIASNIPSGVASRF